MELSTTQKHLCDHIVSLGSPKELCSATMAVWRLNGAISSTTNNYLSNARLEAPRKRHKSLLVYSTWDARGEEESSLRDAACLEYCSMQFPTLQKLTPNRAFQSAFHTRTSLRPLYGDLKSKYRAHFTGGKKLMEGTCSIPAHYFQSLPTPDSWSHRASSFASTPTCQWI